MPKKLGNDRCLVGNIKIKNITDQLYDLIEFQNEE